MDGIDQDNRKGGMIFRVFCVFITLKIEVGMQDRFITDMGERLPQTRREAFFFYYRENLGTILNLGLRCAILLVPAIITLWLKESYFDSLLQGLSEVTAEGAASARNSTNALFGIIENIAMMLFVVFLSGTFQVIRQLLWKEILVFKVDYQKGIRRNGGRFLLAALPVGLVDAFLKWSVPSTPTFLLRAIWAVILLPVCAWFMLQTVYYQFRILEGFRNAVILYIRTWPVTLLLLAVTALPFYIGSIAGYLQILKYLALLIVAFVFVVPMTMVWMLYANEIFDKYINQENYPEYYRKGLQR